MGLCEEYDTKKEDLMSQYMPPKGVCKVANKF